MGLRMKFKPFSFFFSFFFLTRIPFPGDWDLQNIQK